jgi:hypothetical protein
MERDLSIRKIKKMGYVMGTRRRLEFEMKS